jgi:hypothetical protein
MRLKCTFIERQEKILGLEVHGLVTVVVPAVQEMNENYILHILLWVWYRNTDGS